MVNFKEKYHFSRFRRGSKFFQGVQLFPGGGGGGGGGSNCLFPIETQITCDFPGGGVRTPCPPPPSGSALGCDLFSFSVHKIMRSPLALVLKVFSCNFVFSRAPLLNRFLNLLHDCCLVYPTSFAIRLCFLHSLIKDSSISFCWGSFLFLSKPF